MNKSLVVSHRNATVFVLYNLNENGCNALVNAGVNEGHFLDLIFIL